MGSGETTLRRLVLTGLMIAALTAGATAAGATVVPRLAPVSTSPSAQPSASAEPTALPSAEPTPTASASASPSPTTSPRPADAFATWAVNLSGPLGIPVTALEAYGYAEWVVTQTRPTCKLRWTTLAAIGRITSDHGRTGERALDDQGSLRPVLIGPALDGKDKRLKVPDTDGGALDGDTVWDRAVGPMQMVPADWRSSGVDADGDELANPQDIDDAALSAAYLLCGIGRDLSTVADWKAAVNGYHDMAQHLDKVFEVAEDYAALSARDRYPQRR